MAVTFSRAWPDTLCVVAMSFFPAPMLETVRTRSGGKAAISMGTTLWHGSFEMPPLDEDQFGIVRAWAATLIEGETFFGYDIFRERPLAHPTGTLAAKINTVTNSKTIALKETTSSLTLAPGDFLSFDYGSGNANRALHMVVEGGTAAGNNLTIEVRPFVKTGWATDAVVTLVKPTARMHLVPGTYQESVGVDRLGKISFEAEQRL